MAKKESTERIIKKLSKGEASEKVWNLLKDWFKLKQDLKDTANAYKEKIKDIELEIIATLQSTEPQE